MKYILSMVCGLLAMTSIGIAASRSGEGTNTGEKIPIVISGYVTKIELKKNELMVHGTEVNPAAPPAKFQARGAGRGGGGGGRGSHTPDEAMRDFTVNVTSDTILETEKSKLTLNDLAVQDYVVILANPKGKSIIALSITVSNR